LPYWVGEELWRVELAEPVREVPHQLQADRGRLLERVDRWDRAARVAFATACILRVRDLVAEVLRAEGHPAEADGLLGREEMLEVKARAAELARSSLPDRARHLLGFCTDAIEFAPNAACAAYIAAIAAAEARGSAAGADEERAWQARWLCDRVGIEHGPTR
jgi:hypothetical protein